MERSQKQTDSKGEDGELGESELEQVAGGTGDTSTHEVGHWVGLYHTSAPKPAAGDTDVLQLRVSPRAKK